MGRLGVCVVKVFGLSIALVWVSGCASVHSSANQVGDLRAQSSEPSPNQPSSTASTDSPTAHGRILTLDLADRTDSVGDPPYTEPLFSKEYGMLLLQDTGYLLTRPLHWEKREWVWFSVATVGLVGMSFLDRAFSEIVQ